MKTIKILLLFTVFSAVTFYSCSDSDAIEKRTTATAQKSVALRTAFNEIKKANNIDGRAGKKLARTTTNPFCFDFVYPVVFSYNNGTLITVTTFEGLIDLLGNESPTFYMEGVVFPFQVTYGGAVHTISNDLQFNALIDSCGYDSLADDLQHSFCFDIIFPIQLLHDNQQVTIESIEALTAYLSQNGNSPEIVFPVSVAYNGQTVVLNNLYELYQMIDNCDSCTCSDEYAPVCVQTPTGIHEFGNICYAICAGFTQNDLVPCNPSNDCDISDLHATVGSCNANASTYQLTVNFSYLNPAEPNFNILDSNNTILATFPLTALPVTFDFPVSNASIENLHVQMGDFCIAYTSWNVPNCGCPCPTNIDPVCVQTPNGLVQFNNACLAQCEGYTQNDFIECGVAPGNFGTQLGSCFNIVFPVQINVPGTIGVTVHNDGELLQYWHPAVSAIPDFVYPVMVNFTDINFPVTIETQSQFEGQISESCF